MMKRNKILRPLALILSLGSFLFILTSCFRQTVTYASDEPVGSAAADPYEGAASVPPEDDDPGPSATPVGEVFAAGVGQVLLNASDQYAELTAAQYDLLFNPAKLGGCGRTETTLSFINADSADDHTTYVIEEILGDEAGDASLVIDKQTADGVSGRCGLYFYDNLMLVRKADTEKPAVLHALNMQVAESYASLPAFERYSRILCDTTAPKNTKDEWKAAIDKYLALVSDIAKEPDYSAGEEAGELAAIKTPCTASTLKLMGERALTVTRALIALLGQDTSLKSCFNSQYESGTEAYGATGLDGMLRDIDALEGDERKASVLTFRLLASDVPVGISVTLTAGDKTFGLELFYYMDGPIWHNRMTFTGFDGSGVFLSDINAGTGRNTYAETFLYKVTDPGGTVPEKMTATVESTVTDAGFEAHTHFSHTRAAAGDTQDYGLSGTVAYLQEESGGTISSTAHGTLILLDGDRSGTYNMEMTCVQTDETIPVAPPDYLISSGIKTADQQGLFEALGDFDGAAYAVSTMTTQRLAALMLLFN